MTNPAWFTVSNPLYGWILVLVCLVGGIHGIQNIGRLEDPPFPIRLTYIITSYPGASAVEVEQEVTERIEDALQELAHIDFIESRSVPGRSEVRVRLLEHFSEAETPQVFDELRRRVREAEMFMPPGVDTPLVEDDFSDIYGVLYSLKAPGYANHEIHDIARTIATRVKLVDGVAKVDTRGLPQEAVYVELDDQRLTTLGLSIDDIEQRIRDENEVVGSGSAIFDGRRLRIAQSTTINSVATLAGMKLGLPGSTEIIRLGDVATVKRTGIEVPYELVRLNGGETTIIAVSVTPGQNVVAVGKNIDRKMQQLERELPVGVELTPVYKQHRVVEQAINNFLKNLTISVVTVMMALMLFMGWRAGTVVGAVLLLTVLGTVGIMYFMDIELQRISLGALMIAMGMLVDNGVVIAEGMVVGVRRGRDAREAAVQAVARTQYPLLGATIIGILAFAPISLSNDNSGRFLISLFQVVGISLLLSWILAVTVIPLLGNYLLKPSGALSEEQLYRAWYFKPYHFLINFGLRRARITSVIILAITVACLYSMQFVKTAFFPSNNTPLFYIDYRLQEGTDIITTSEDIRSLEEMLLDMDGIESVASFIGRGAPRFTATQQPEQPNPAYVQMIVRVTDIERLSNHMQEARVRLVQLRPDAEIKISRAEFSPASGSKIEMRYTGPDPTVLRELGEQTLAVYLKHNLRDRKTDWRAQSLQLVPEFNESNARLAGISRNDVAKSLAYNTHGVNIGLIRDGDKLIPVIARAPDAERTDLAGLKDKQVWSATQRRFIPLTQVVSKFSLQADNTTILRRDRMRTLTAQADPPPGHNVNEYFLRLKGEVEAIELPPGYNREWGGEFESNMMANEALTQRMPHAFGLMFFITVLMFGALRQPIVIWLTVPMILCGVAIGLLITNLPLTFPSFLGVLSLSGMLIKNCIVLVDEIDKRLAEEPGTIETMIMASLSRLRPVMLASLTTVFGMSPLLTDAFFREMAVCIMSGLIFATLLTLVAVPVFYRLALGRRITGAA